MMETNLNESSTDSISDRLVELTRLLQDHDNFAMGSRSFILSHGGLLDALLCLYEECNHERLMHNNKYVNTFVQKYRPTISEINHLRISVSDFEVKDVIGRGHFGEVQVVRERVTGTVYAMKILRKSETLSQPNMAFFEEERDIMAQAQSVWITQLHYAFQDSLNLYLVMDFHAGGDLLSLLAKYDDVFDEKMARFYLAEIALAVGDLHNMGYVHRDVKPENLLLDAGGHIKLADFGSAARLTRTKTVEARMPVGTPDYVSPELLMSVNSCDNAPNKYGVEVDWWSLGICAYEMLYGMTPFTDDNGSIVTTYSNIMNYKTSLKFPDDPVISSSTMSLIKGLLTDTSSRLDYNAICAHDFFTHTDLQNIRSAKPPVIPTITGQDDTSNFDEFERLRPPPCLDDLLSHREFSGRDLPFVGFTFSKFSEAQNDKSDSLHSVDSDFTSVSSIKPMVSMTPVVSMAPARNSTTTITTSTLTSNSDGTSSGNGLEVKLTVKIEELRHVKQKCHELESSEVMLKSDLDKLRHLYQDREDELFQAEESSLTLQDELDGYTQRYQDLADKLAIEVAERKRIDDAAIQIWTDLQDMNDQAKLLEQELVESEADELRKIVVQLEVDRDSLTKKLSRKQRDLESSSTQLEKSQRRVSELQTKVDKERRKSRDDQKRELVLLENREDKWKEQQNDKTDQIALLNSKIEALEEEIRSLKLKEDAYRKDGTTENKIMVILDRLDNQRSQERLWQTKEQDFTLKIKDLEGRLDLYRTKGRLAPQSENHLYSRLVKYQDEIDTQKSTIKELKKQVDRFSEEETSASTMYSNNTKKVQELEEELRHVKDEKHSVTIELKKHQREHDDKSSKVTQLDGKISALNLEVDKLKQTISENDKHEKEMNTSKARADASARLADERVKDIEREKGMLEARITSLETQLTRTRGESQTEENQLRVLQNDLKQKSEDHKQQLEDIRSKFTDTSLQLSESKAKVASCERREKSLQQKLEDVEKRLKTGVCDIEEALRKAENDKKLALEAYEQESHEKTVMAERYQRELKLSRSECDKMERKYKDLESGLDDILKEKSKLKMDMQSFKDELTNSNHEKEMLTKKVDMLKNITTELESQMCDLEGFIQHYEKREADWSSTKKTYEKAVNEHEDELEGASHQISTEQRARQAIEEKVVTLRKRLDSDKSMYRMELESLGKQLSDSQAVINRLKHQASNAEQLNMKAEMVMKTQHRSIETEREELLKLKEEISRQITTNQVMREENLRLKHNLDEAMDKFELIFGEKVTLENIMEKLQGCHFLEKYRFESTICQQMKLIDYLHAKTETQPGKKKKNKLKDSSCGTTLPTTISTDNLSALELERKRCVKLQQKVDNLRSENYKQAAELLELKGPLLDKVPDTDPVAHTPLRQSFSCSTTIHTNPKKSLNTDPETPVYSIIRRDRSNSQNAMTLLTPKVNVTHHNSLNRALSHGAGLNKNPHTTATPKQSNPPRFVKYTDAITPLSFKKTPQTTKQRMRHNIPHRFITGLNTRATKCAVCLGSVHFVKQASKCQECKMVCHPKCVSSAPSSCGLPTEYVQHLDSTISRLNIDGSPFQAIHLDNALNMAGWIKVPRTGKSGWEKRWLRLDGMLLILYMDDEASTPVDEFELCPTDSTVTIHSAVTAAELSNTANTDLSYILKLESTPFTTCWPGRVLYLMAVTFAEKQRWVATMEAAINSTEHEENMVNARVLGKTLLHLARDERLELNCCLAIDEKLMLLGADEGLFAHMISGPLVKIPGLASVHQLTYAESVHSVIVITGDKREVFLVDKRSILNYLSRVNNQSVVPTKLVEGIVGCTVFDCGDWKDESYLVVGMPDKVNIMTFNHKMGMYFTRKSLNIHEPCSCVLVVNNYALIGCEKYYYLDLEFPVLTEFVDRLDNSLAFAAFGAASHKSFPLAIIQVSPANQPEEFLLCFHEFGVFVDAKGRRSRIGDMKWSGLPLGFAYAASCLYVTFFHCIQMVEIPSTADLSGGLQKTIAVVCPRYLGTSFSNTGMCYVSSTPTTAQILCYHANAVHRTNSNINSNNCKENVPAGLHKRLRFVSPQKINVKTRLVRATDSSTSLDSSVSTSSMQSYDSSDLSIGFVEHATRM